MALKYKEKQDALMVETSEHTKSIRADFEVPAPVRLDIKSEGAYWRFMGICML